MLFEGFVHVVPGEGVVVGDGVRVGFYVLV